MALDEASTFLTVQQLADRYSVSPATVYGWLHKRTGPRSHKIGRHRRFRLDDVVAWEAAKADDYLAAAVLPGAVSCDRDVGQDLEARRTPSPCRDQSPMYGSTETTNDISRSPKR